MKHSLKVLPGSLSSKRQFFLVQVFLVLGFNHLEYLDPIQASLFVLSCLIFIYLYFLLAKPADTNFNLLVEDEEDYQVDFYDDDDIGDQDKDHQVEDDCNHGAEVGDDLER